MNGVLPELTPQTPLLWLLISIITGLLLFTGADIIPASFRRHLQMVRWVLIPYLGLLSGGLSPQLMGLTYLNWFSIVEQNAILILAILAAALLIRITLEVNQRRIDTPGRHQDSIYALQVIDKSKQQKSTVSIHWAVLFLIFLQNSMLEFHLSFLRGALWEMLQHSALYQTLPHPFYWAIGLAALLFAIENWLHPATGTQRILALILIGGTSILFVYTVNYWLCAMVRGVAWWIMMPRRHYPDDEVYRFQVQYF